MPKNAILRVLFRLLYTLMSEQFHFPFMDASEQQLDLDLPKDKAPEPELQLTDLDREALETLYMEKVGFKRYPGRTDEELHEAIRNPEKEISRLREIDRVDDAWADLGPTGK